MKKPNLLQISEVRTADVVMLERLRPVSEAAVESLVNSYTELGVLKDEIHVRKKRDGQLVLIAGAHRLAMFKRLQIEMIPAKVWTDCSDDWAKLMEIDDNVAGAELNPLDTAVFLARRKELWEKLHPETKADAFKGNRHTGRLVSDTMSFTRTTAEKFGMSVRHVERMVAAGSKITLDQVKQLRAAPRGVTLKDLGEISKIGEAEERAAVVLRLAVGNAKSAADARRSLKAEAGEGDAPEEAAKDAPFNALLKAWTRAPVSVRKRFCLEMAREIWDVQNKGVALTAWREAEDV